MPVSFGFHPYLRLPGKDRAEWRIRLPARRHLAADARGIPTGRTLLEPAESFTLGDRWYDDGYDQLPDGAWFSVDDGDRTIRLTLAFGFPAAQIYAPPRAQFVCFEPMTAPTNALRSGWGLRRVEPGEEFEAAFRIGIA